MSISFPVKIEENFITSLNLCSRNKISCEKFSFQFRKKKECFKDFLFKALYDSECFNKTIIMVVIAYSLANQIAVIFTLLIRSSIICKMRFNVFK